MRFATVPQMTFSSLGSTLSHRFFLKALHFLHFFSCLPQLCSFSIRRRISLAFHEKTDDSRCVPSRSCNRCLDPVTVPPGYAALASISFCIFFVFSFFLIFYIFLNLLSFWHKSGGFRGVECRRGTVEMRCRLSRRSR